MTAKEKAKDLVDKFIPNMPYANTNEWAKKCALIALEEMRNELKDYDDTVYDGYGYWEQVKNEIEQL
jgi:hypothetical protein